MKRRSNLPLYLLLNIIVSAVTTLVVLVVWDNVRKAEFPAAQLPQVAAQETAAPRAGDSEIGAQNTPASGQELVSHTAATPAPTETLPPVDVKVIQVLNVVGVGDLDQEVVLLKRIGEGNIRMTGWKLTGERGGTYTFPEQPELIVYKDGAVQIYTKTGTDTATEVYWNRSEPAWQSGETIKVFDPDGNERAAYVVP